MNILFVCSAKSWGGNEKWTAMAMKHLSEEHSIFFFGRKKALADSFGSAEIKGFAPMFSYWDIYSFFKAWRFLKHHNINCVVSTKKKEYFIFGVLSRILHIKHIIRLGIVRDMKLPFWHKLLYYHLNDGIIVNANKIASNLYHYSYMNNKKIYVLYNAIPGLNDIRLTLPQKQKKAFHIVSTGMLTKRKGFHILVQAIASFEPEFQQNLKVSFAGSGREEENLKKLIKKHNLDQTIELTGFQKNPVSVLKGANLFVLLSGNEGISNALLEAMAAGVPVLTTDSGGSREFITDGLNGFITDRNAQSAARKIRTIINSDIDALYKTGLKGRETVLALFDEDRFHDELTAIFSY